MVLVILSLGLVGLLLARFGVSGIVTKQLEFSNESGRTTTLKASPQSSLAASSQFSVSGCPC